MSMSRLLKLQKKKLIKQTIFLFLFGTISTLVFFVFIMPFSIDFLFKVFVKDLKQEDQEIELRPQIPILLNVPKYINKKILKLSGYASKNSKVIFVDEYGKQIGFMTVGDDTKFEYTLKLKPGKNVFKVYAKDKNGNESEISKSYIVIYDNKKPDIKIIEPKDGTKFRSKASQLVTIKGETEPNAKVYYEDRVFLADSSGKFTMQVYLKEGENIFKIKAVDKAGNENTIEYKLYFEY